MAETPNLAVFYDRCRNSKILGPVLDPTEFSGIDATLRKCAEMDLRVAYVAYILATDYHETDGTMQPIKERGGNGYFHRMYDPQGSRPALAKRNGNIHPGDGIKFPGRGKVQITWRGNYERVGKLIGVDLVNNPDRAMEMLIAVRIEVEGMLGGWFTGRKLAHYLPAKGKATRVQFKASRPIINGTDKADLIAGYAVQFQDWLIETGWPV